MKCLKKSGHCGRVLWLSSMAEFYEYLKYFQVNNVICDGMALPGSVFNINQNTSSSVLHPKEVQMFKFCTCNAAQKAMELSFCWQEIYVLGFSSDREFIIAQK